MDPLSESVVPRRLLEFIASIASSPFNTQKRQKKSNPERRGI